MKTPRPKSLKSGFTLVELLVVIAIIAVLAAAGFAGGNAAIQKARKTTALSVATSVESAIESFYSDYSALPYPPSSPQSPTTDGEYPTSRSGSGTGILNVLEARGAGVSQNDRKVRYLSLREASKGDRDGIVYSGTGNSTTVVGLFDPWEQPFKLILDYDYNEELDVSGVPGGGNTLRGRRVAVYSDGTDETPNAKTVVKSW